MGGNGSTHNDSKPGDDLEESVEQKKESENESDGNSEKTENIIPEEETPKIEL